MTEVDILSNLRNAERSMKTIYFIGRSVRALAIGAAALASPVALAEDVNMFDGQWHYGLTVYGWFPAMTTDASFTLPNGATAAPSVTVKPKNYLSDLQFGAMGAFQARNGNLSLFTDIIYADISSLNSRVTRLHTPDGDITPPLNVDVNVGLKELIWTFGAGYTVARSDQGNLDVVGGARYGSLKTSLGVNAFGPGGIFGTSASGNANADVWTGIIGVKGALRLSDDGKWYMPYEADIGFGSTSHSSVTNGNAILAVGYKFSWGDLVGGWRYLSYDMGSSAPIQKLIMSGPALGATFRW
jgi:hypothetical protein